MTMCPKHQRPMRQLGAELLCSACLAEASAPNVGRMAELAAREQKRVRASLMDGVGIPAAFQGASFASWVSETERSAKVLAAMSNYCGDFESRRSIRSGFIFTGSPGTGKTHLACAMAADLAARGYRSLYLSLPAFTRQIKTSFGKLGHTDVLLRSAIDADLLVLDEIDLHGTTDNDYSILYDVINGRYERGGRPTVAISNRNKEHLVADLDARIVSRILGGTDPIAFDWPSQRDKRASRRTSITSGVAK